MRKVKYKLFKKNFEVQKRNNISIADNSNCKG